MYTGTHLYVDFASSKMSFRIVPTMLLSNGDVVKTKKFKNPQYIGDPINSVRIFNQKCIDEMIILDIDAGKKNHYINYDLLSRISAESFFPITYGGGIKNFEDAKKIFSLGFEKISIQTAAFEDKNLVKKISQAFGRQSIVISIDLKKNFFNKMNMYSKLNNKFIKGNLLEYINDFINHGAGELHLNFVDKDGTLSGYNIEYIASIISKIRIPVIISGGLSCLSDIRDIKNIGVSAAAGGAFFIYYGTQKGILLNYPCEEDLRLAVGDRFE